MDNLTTKRRHQVRKHRIECWREENRDTIKAYNDHIKKYGLWHRGHTTWR